MHWSLQHHLQTFLSHHGGWMMSNGDWWQSDQMTILLCRAKPVFFGGDLIPRRGALWEEGCSGNLSLAIQQHTAICFEEWLLLQSVCWHQQDQVNNVTQTGGLHYKNTSFTVWEKQLVARCNASSIRHRTLCALVEINEWVWLLVQLFEYESLWVGIKLDKHTHIQSQGKQCGHYM